ncbi:mechanosensitive ion channel domain-containing protein [Neptunicella sp. SCSIO 80796]|uniref:mechanosensitive ion channel domain-containing protein n=1 Tax=Neptunicella plasticusilytica TaxID=3117012 RepID=UPI003A4D1FCB
MSTFTLAQQTDIKSLSDQIDVAAKQLEADSKMSADKQQQASEQLERAQQLLDETEQTTRLVDSYEQLVAEANSRLAELNTRTKQLANENVAAIKNGSADKLSNELVVMVAEQNALLSELSTLQKEQTVLNSRSNAIGEELVSARDTLDTLQHSLAETKPQHELSELANYLEQQAKIFKLQSTINNFEREVVTIPARKSLVAAKLALLREQVRLGEKRIAAVRDYLNQSRMGEATQAVESSRHALDSTGNNSALAVMGKENLQLAKSLKELIGQEPKKDDNSARLRAQIVDLQQSAETVERVLATGSLTDELGVLLRQLQAGLPRQAPLEKRLEQIKESSVRQQLNLILWQERLRNLSDPETAASRLLAQHAPNNNASEQDMDAAKKLIEARSELLQQLIDASIASADRLAEEKRVITEAITRTEELTSLLDRRLVWLPSNAGLADNVWHNLAVSAKWVLAPSAWLQAVEDLWSGVKKSPFLTIIFLLLPALIFAARPAVKRSLAGLLSRVGKVGKDTYWATPMALAETLLLALPLPILIGTMAGLLSTGSQPGSFSSALATALGAVSSLSLVLLFFRSMCRNNGIFVGHFGWSDKARAKLRGILFWFVWLQSIATFVFALAMAGDAIELRYGLAGLAFIAGSVGISLFCYAFFKPKGGVASSIVGDTPATLLTLMAFPVLVASPLLIGLLPLFGFFDTAVALQSKLFLSGVVLIFTAILYGILMRIFLVAYRRFSLRRQKARRAEQELQRSKKQEADASGEALPMPKTDRESDPEQVDRQTRSILTGFSAVIFLVSLWFIWKPLLPALGIVDDIVLWQRVQIVDGVEISSGVTLWNIILALLLMFGGFVAARNMRGILEVGFFERFNLDPGARYAAVTIMGYVLVGLGIVIGLSQLGIDWSKLQWIVAALGVGLGFGLQEIVANFVSGLIILFERPIRVGDTVTIGNLSGTVSNIKIRATTVTDFDNREVLLPNKSIITENVTNWTLNDAVTRIVLAIGVAYGSDISQVRDLLMKVIESHADVLKLPAPNVFFMNHGASSLDFEVRVFVSTPAKRLPVTHDINSMINQTLKEHNINIPFPQRDLHIISKPPIEDESKDNG